MCVRDTRLQWLFLNYHMDWSISEFRIQSAAVIAAHMHIWSFEFLLAQIGLCWADCAWASFLSTWPHLLRLVHRITAALHQILNQNRFHAILRSIILMNNFSFPSDNWQCVVAFFFWWGELGRGWFSSSWSHLSEAKQQWCQEFKGNMKPDDEGDVYELTDQGRTSFEVVNMLQSKAGINLILLWLSNLITLSCQSITIPECYLHQ